LEGQDLASITVEAWEAWIDQSFGVGAEEGSGAFMTIKLIEAQPRHGHGFGGRVPYSLLFRGSATSPLTQSTWWLSHPGLGTMPVFLVPVGANSDGFDYEAIFS